MRDRALNAPVQAVSGNEVALEDGRSPRDEFGWAKTYDEQCVVSAHPSVVGSSPSTNGCAGEQRASDSVIDRRDLNAFRLRRCSGLPDLGDCECAVTPGESAFAVDPWWACCLLKVICFS